MPKLRNAETELGMLAQWMGRKCRNHHPLAELGLSEQARARTPNSYAEGKHAKSVDVSALADDESTIFYRQGDRVFRLKLDEVEVEEYEKLQRIAVSY